MVSWHFCWDQFDTYISDASYSSLRFTVFPVCQLVPSIHKTFYRQMSQEQIPGSVKTEMGLLSHSYCFRHIYLPVQIVCASDLYSASISGTVHVWCDISSLRHLFYKSMPGTPASDSYWASRTSDVFPLNPVVLKSCFLCIHAFAVWKIWCVVRLPLLFAS